MFQIRQQTLMRFHLDGEYLRLVGYYDQDTDPGCWEWFEIFDIEGNCLNQHSPLYTADEQVPDLERIVEHLSLCLA
jgi:hypothetical protein